MVNNNLGIFIVRIYNIFLIITTKTVLLVNKRTVPLIYSYRGCKERKKYSNTVY